MLTIRPALKALLILILLWMAMHRIKAQQMPVELMPGNDRIYYQHNIAIPLEPGSKYGFFHTASFHSDHADKRSNEVMGQAYLTYAAKPSLRIALGGFHATAPGTSGSFAIHWSHKWDRVLLLLAPRIDLRRTPSLELMGMIEYAPRSFQLNGPYARFQFMVNGRPERHNRSYRYLRIGWAFGATRLGVALNMDSYGPCRHTLANWGVFFRRHLGST